VSEFAPVNLLDLEAVDQLVRSTPVDVVINFAAATNVDEVERGRPGSLPEAVPGEALRLNSLAPEAMARATRATGKSLLSLSTDFVFSGTSGPYPETALPDPLSPRLSWYGYTKGDGEGRLRASDPNAVVLRIAYPYRPDKSGKLDFAQRIVRDHRRGTLLPMFADQQITPTWVPDVSRAIEHATRHWTPGTFHVASPQVTTPFRFAQELLRAVERHPVDVTAGSLEQFLERPGATPRPVRGGLECLRLPAAGVALTDWQSGIQRFVREGGGSE
jgi:dTDP-4-dehydrorhamnose reductase